MYPAYPFVMDTITDRYLRRIGLRRQEATDPDALLAAHVDRISFEDLDGVAGIPVRTDIDAVTDKLVDRRRGGYCHEHARLSQHVLADLGYECVPVLARVYRDPTLTAPMPLTHHLTLVHRPGGWRIFDPGFGGGTPTRTVPLDGEVIPAPDADLRVVSAEPVLGEAMVADSVLLLQRDYRDGRGWQNAYGFAVRRALEADVEMANWFTATHPGVMFTTTPIAARHLPDGTRLTLRGRLFRRLGPETLEQRELVDPEDFARVLGDEFLIDAPGPVIDSAWEAAGRI